MRGLDASSLGARVTVGGLGPARGGEDSEGPTLEAGDSTRRGAAGTVVACTASPEAKGKGRHPPSPPPIPPPPPAERPFSDYPGNWNCYVGAQGFALAGRLCPQFQPDRSCDVFSLVTGIGILPGARDSGTPKKGLGTGL